MESTLLVSTTSNTKVVVTSHNRHIQSCAYAFTRRTTLGDRAFPVTAARAWNSLPLSARSAPSLLQFRRDLKTALF